MSEKSKEGISELIAEIKSPIWCERKICQRLKDDGDTNNVSSFVGTLEFKAAFLYHYGIHLSERKVLKHLSTDHRWAAAFAEEPQRRTYRLLQKYLAQPNNKGFKEIYYEIIGAYRSIEDCLSELSKQICFKYTLIANDLLEIAEQWKAAYEKRVEEMLGKDAVSEEEMEELQFFENRLFAILKFVDPSRKNNVLLSTSEAQTLISENNLEDYKNSIV
jgi:hypothetical protein